MPPPLSLHRLVACLLLGGAAGLLAGEPSAPLDGPLQRVPWNNTQLRGSPEPPLPYTVEKVLTNLSWKSPLYVIEEPDRERLWVIQQGGEPERPSLIRRVAEESSTTNAELVLELPRRLIYSVCFHPGYHTNRTLFLFSNGPTGASERTNRISRYLVAVDSEQRLRLENELPILEWRSAGHDGGDLAFGLDGFLYITTGDGTSDSDGWDSGQTLDDLLGSVLRIDVGQTNGVQNYAVPPDNPFVGRAGARPEIWAYGLRNPWRMGIDPTNGNVWVGNNGQDLWETAHLVHAGENYGWSIFEGSHPFYLERRRGPTPLVAPTIEHPHSEFRSLTGGVVCYGDIFPELNGVYLYGDYATGRIWGMNHDGRRVLWHRELADTRLQIAAFRVTRRGQVLIVDNGGGIYRLMRAPSTAPAPFPKRLSDSGLFASVAKHQPAPGLIPYSVNVPGWADGARAERFLAVPADGRVAFDAGRGWELPDDSVLVQTLTLEREVGQPASLFRVETRVFLRQQGEWAGYSYRWNAAQTDADLVPKGGADDSFAIRDGAVAGGIRRQSWRFPSRSECMVCHSRAANFLLGLTGRQLNRAHSYGGTSTNQLRALEAAALFKGKLPKSDQELGYIADPWDSAQPLEDRARAYLGVNCAVCHTDAGGGNARMELDLKTPRERMNILAARPQHDTFGITNAMLVAPGDPPGSVLVHRLSRRGRGQMPPLGTSRVDERAVQLMRDWIAQLKPERTFVRAWQMDELLPVLPEMEHGRNFENGRDAFKDVGCLQCHRLNGVKGGGSVGPDLTGLTNRLDARALLESILLPSQVIADEYANYEIETESGQTFAGRIEREDAAIVVLRTSSAEEPLVELKRTAVRRRQRSAVSNMPSGIVDVLTREQLLDLMAYVLAGGDAASPRFH
jgi:uncharacterized repeat protein (TIGR03806 family)